MKMLWISTISFVAGVGASYLYLKNKFDQQTQNEVSEAREYYKKAMDDFVEDLAKGNVEETNEEIKEEKIPEEIIENYIPNEESVEEKPKPKKKGGRKKKVTSDSIVISSDEFVELNGYDKITLYFFDDDKIFSNTDYEVVEDGLAMVGEDNLDCVSLYEDEVLYVRSDKFGADIEVIYKEGSYRDFVEDN